MKKAVLVVDEPVSCSMHNISHSEWCAEGYTNNWRKLHHYPMRRKHKKHYTYPCNALRKDGLCEFPFC